MFIARWSDSEALQADAHRRLGRASAREKICGLVEIDLDMACEDQRAARVVAGLDVALHDRFDDECVHVTDRERSGGGAKYIAGGASNRFNTPP